MNVDEFVGYVEAWQLWFSGVKLEGYTMWALPMLWWARIGKLMQFAGGLVVVLDLIGTERFEKASHRIRASGARTGKLINTLPGYVGIGSLVVFFAPATLLVLYTLFTDGTDGFMIGDPLFAVLLVIFFVIPTFVVALAPLSPWFLRGIGWLVALGKNGHAAQWFAVGLVAIGFHLDLLAS